MDTLPEQFAGALSRIEIKGEKRQRAVAAQTEIRELLERDNGLCAWGVDTVLIGSYARNTGIHPGKDVDVFVKLTELDTTASPSGVYEAVREVLVAEYGGRAQPQARSIKVSFDADGDGFSVDAVPAVRLGHRWAIPQRDPALWIAGDALGRWVETDPEQLAKLTSELNDTLKVGSQGAYVPVVKLVRQARCHHLGDAKPGGLFFELLSFWAFKTDIHGETFAELFAATLAETSAQLEHGTQLLDPVLGRPFEPQPNAVERGLAATTFKELAQKAERALTVGRCRAAVLWREILGENDRGQCFPLPPGCDEEGNEIRNVAAVAAVGSREASGFASGRST